MLRLHFVFPSVLQDNKALQVHEVRQKHIGCARMPPPKSRPVTLVVGELVARPCFCNCRNKQKAEETMLRIPQPDMQGTQQDIRVSPC